MSTDLITARLRMQPQVSAATEILLWSRIQQLLRSSWAAPVNSVEEVNPAGKLQLGQTFCKPRFFNLFSIGSHLVFSILLPECTGVHNSYFSSLAKPKKGGERLAWVKQINRFGVFSGFPCN